jgi:predicted DNA-binding WGR domain protein
MPDDPIEYLVLDPCDSDGNMARFYVRSIEASLFGDAALIRKWGRIGTTGQRRGELHKGYRRASEGFRAWLGGKHGRGLCSPRHRSP